MTVKDAATLIGVTPAQVRWLIRAGKLPAKRKEVTTNQHGYTYFVRVEDARRYRDSQRKTGPPKTPKST